MKKTEVIKTEENEELYKLYFSADLPSSYGSVQKLYKAAKKTMPDITLKQVKYWLEHQEVYGAFRAQRHIHQRRHYYVGEAYREFEYDIAIFKQWKEYQFPVAYASLLIFIDVFSKKVYAKPLKRRSAPEVAAATAVILDSMPQTPISIRSDKEAAFRSYLMKAVCRARNVTQTFTTFLPKVNGTLLQLLLTADFQGAIVERFIGTYKNHLGKAMTHQNMLNIPYQRKNQWPAMTVDLLTAYNNTYNRAVGMTPNEAALQSNQKAVLAHREQYFATFKYHKKTPTPFTYNIGDKVLNVKIPNIFHCS